MRSVVCINITSIYCDLRNLTIGAKLHCNIGPVLLSCTAALVQLVGVKKSMFVSFQLIALVQ